ncbi:styrene monooxygenase/indole monooxygenase family protein [Salinactinospora qingdaonensis]|uniref:Alanine-phosphoribitol ligase n=1 Tax=Salinactinospora qingdaonensis TaxID=702744 RepID=A0ABP7GJ18_9ACTN
MTRVAIVGAGQSGLVLAHTLLEAGVEVEVFTNHDPSELRFGNAEPTQATFPATLEAEQQAGLDEWSTAAPRFATVSVSARPPQAVPVGFVGALPGQGGVAVDPREKMAAWLESFDRRGGRVHIHGVTVSELDWYACAGRYDLIVVAVGGGELGALFAPDAEQAQAAGPRALCQVYLDGLLPGEADVQVVTTPHGEIFRVPILTGHGPAESVFLSARLEGALDCRPTHGRRVDVYAELLTRLRAFAPDLYEQCATAEVVDAGAAILTRTKPARRRPVGYLPSGGTVLGMGDTVRPLCPTTGQGWAGSTRAALTYRDHILTRAKDGGPFDAAFMHHACADYDTHFVQPAGGFLHMIEGFWSGDLSESERQRFHEATVDPEAANAWLARWDHPSRSAPPVAP